MGETEAELFGNLDRKKGKRPDLGASTLLILIYLSLSLLSVFVVLTAHILNWSSNSGSFVQIAIFAFYILGFFSFLFLFIGGILVASGITHRHPQHRKLVLSGVAIVIGSILYPAFISLLSPLPIFIAVLIEKTNLGIVAQENIYYLGGVVVQFLLINTPLVALGLLLSERGWQRKLLKISILLLLIIVVSNFLTTVIFTPQPSFAFPVIGFSFYNFIQHDALDIMQIVSYVCIAAVFLRCNMDMRMDRKGHKSRG